MRPLIPLPALVLPCLLFSALAVSPSAAGSPPRAQAGKPGFDSAQVRKLYQDGDFEPAIGILEDALRSNRIPEHRDSVFVYKHLGVMYAANENTRERGKYFMLQLLTIEPTARIMDMYASDMIYMIFRNIQEEFSLSHGQAGKTPPRQAEPAQPVPDRGPARPAKTPAGSGRGKTVAWVGAAVLAIGAGTALYVLGNAGPSETRINHEVK